MNKFVSWVALVISVIALFAMVGGNEQSQSFGGIGTRFPNGIAIGQGASITTAGTFVLGSSGTSHDKILSGTVNCTGPDVTLIPGGTSTTTCAVSGVSSGDTVIIVPPAGHLGSLQYSGVATTSDVIGVVLYNATTSSATIAANSTSSVGYVIFSR